MYSLSSQHPHGYCGESRCWAGILFYNNRQLQLFERKDCRIEEPPGLGIWKNNQNPRPASSAHSKKSQTQRTLDPSYFKEPSGSMKEPKVLRAVI